MLCNLKSGLVQHTFPFQTWISSFFLWWLLKLQLFEIHRWSGQLSLSATHLLSHEVLCKCTNSISNNVPKNTPALKTACMHNTDNTTVSGLSGKVHSSFCLCTLTSKSSKHHFCASESSRLLWITISLEIQDVIPIIHLATSFYYIIYLT